MGGVYHAATEAADMPGTEAVGVVVQNLHARGFVIMGTKCCSLCAVTAKSFKGFCGCLVEVQF